MQVFEKTSLQTNDELTRFGALVHDFGKAAIGFQDYLNGGEPWRYRHEILSTSFVNSLNNIFAKEIIDSIGLCILTHHKDLNQLEKYKTSSKVNIESFNKKIFEL